MDHKLIYLFLGILTTVMAVYYVFRRGQTISDHPGRYLLFQLAFLILTILYGSFEDCLKDTAGGCVEFKAIFVLIGNLYFTMLMGWFEMIQRSKKYGTKSLCHFLKYGIISDLVIVISFITTGLLMYVTFK